MNYLQNMSLFGNFEPTLFEHHSLMPFEKPELNDEFTPIAVGALSTIVRSSKDEGNKLWVAIAFISTALVSSYVLYKYAFPRRFVRTELNEDAYMAAAMINESITSILSSSPEVSEVFEEKKTIFDATLMEWLLEENIPRTISMLEEIQLDKIDQTPMEPVLIKIRP